MDTDTGNPPQATFQTRTTRETALDLAGPDLDRLVDWRELRQVVRVSRVTMWQWRRAGSFPAPVRVSANKIAWRLSDVRRWLESRECA